MRDVVESSNLRVLAACGDTTRWSSVFSCRCLSKRVCVHQLSVYDWIVYFFHFRRHRPSFVVMSRVLILFSLSLFVELVWERALSALRASAPPLPVLGLPSPWLWRLSPPFLGPPLFPPRLTGNLECANGFPTDSLIASTCVLILCDHSSRGAVALSPRILLSYRTFRFLPTIPPLLSGQGLVTPDGWYHFLFLSCVFALLSLCRSVSSVFPAPSVNSRFFPGFASSIDDTFPSLETFV